MAPEMELDLAGRAVLVTGASRGVPGGRRAGGSPLRRPWGRNRGPFTTFRRGSYGGGLTLRRLSPLTEPTDPGTGRAAPHGARRRGIAHARWGTAEEIADVVVFLLSRAARFVNGTVLRADGGQSPTVDY